MTYFDHELQTIPESFFPPSTNDTGDTGEVAYNTEGGGETTPSWSQPSVPSSAAPANTYTTEAKDLDTPDVMQQAASGRFINPNGLDFKQLPAYYQNEQRDSSKFRNKPSSFNPYTDDKSISFDKITTHYMSPQEQQDHTVSVQNGLLGGQQGPIDTAAATGTGTVNQMGQGKHIFAMTPAGEIRQADPWAERKETLGEGVSDMDVLATRFIRQRFAATGASGAPKVDAELATVNHSSLVAGGDVAAAGELTVDQGRLTQVSDQSGHYFPDNVMTAQALGQFESMGVDMHDVGVKLTPKTTKIDLDAPSGAASRYLHASAREMMSYEGAEDAEEQMRDRRDLFRQELTGAVDARERRLRPTDESTPRMHMTDVGGQAGRQVAPTDALLDPRHGMGPTVTDRATLPFSERRDLFAGQF